MHDVLAHPSHVGIAARRDQLERDRLRLLDQLERERLIACSPTPHPGRHEIVDMVRLHADAESILRRWKYTGERRRTILALTPAKMARATDLIIADYYLAE